MRVLSNFRNTVSATDDVEHISERVRSIRIEYRSILYKELRKTQKILRQVDFLQYYSKHCMNVQMKSSKNEI
jgi:hypothetical protein